MFSISLRGNILILHCKINIKQINIAMKKLLFLFAVLLSTVSGWAQESSSAPVIADGVYTIKNEINNRGTLVAVENQTNVGAADITLGGHEGKSETAMTHGDKWYVRTVNGNVFLYNVANGKFVNSSQAATVQFTGTPVTGLSLTKIDNYYVISQGDNKVSCCPGHDYGQTVRWLTNDEADSQYLTFTLVENGETEFAEQIKVADKLILKSLGYLVGRYAIKNANNKYMISNTHGSDIAGSLFELHPDLTKDKAYKIYSVTEGKWVSYVLKDTYDPKTDRVILEENEAYAKAWYIKGMTGNHSGWYEVSPYATIGSVSPIYLNWYEGTLTRNVGFWTSNGTDDSGSRWSFIDFDDSNLLNPLSGTEYVLYDEAHKTFLDIKNLGREPNDKDDYRELATLNSEIQTLYITTTANEGWKIHTASDGGNYLGQYRSGKTWSSKVNADQNEYVWSVEFTPANSEWYYVLHNQNGIKDGYLGTEGHTNGKELYVDQLAGNKALKLKLHKASLVYKVNATPGIGTVIYDGKRYADGDYIFADSEIEEGDLSLVDVIGYSHSLAWDNATKEITATYTKGFDPDGLKVLLKNKQHNKFLGVNFVGGELDNDPVPTTHKFSGNSESDYRNCWELQLTTYESNGSSLPCFVLYNSYYDWYAGKIAGRNTTIDVVKSIDDAGRFDVDCVEETVEGETVKVLTFRCLNKTTTNEYWYLHMVDWSNYGVVDWDYDSNASKWYMTEVTDEMIADLNNLAKVDMTLFKEYFDEKVRPGIGYYSGLTEEQINTIKNIEVGNEDIDIIKAREYLYAIHYKTCLVLNQPSAGFYRIKSQNGHKDERFGKYLQLKADNSGFEESNDATIRSIVYINDAKNLLHYSIGQYQNGYSAPAAVGSQADTWTITENPSSIGAYSLKASSQSNYLSDWYGIGGGQNDNNAVWTFEPVETLPFTFKGIALGYATFNAPVNVDLGETGVVAYIAEIIENESKLKIRKIDGNVVPANTPVLLYKEGVTSESEDVPVNFNIDNVTCGFTATDLESQNDFVGTIAAVNLDNTKNCYSLQKSEATEGDTVGKMGFFKKTSGTKAGFKAWIETPNTTGAARSFTIIFDGDNATGLKEALGLENENVEIYDLSGRRLDKPAKGVNVIGGKLLVK